VETRTRRRDDRTRDGAERWGSMKLAREGGDRTIARARTRLPEKGSRVRRAFGEPGGGALLRGDYGRIRCAVRAEEVERLRLPVGRTSTTSRASSGHARKFGRTAIREGRARYGRARSRRPTYNKLEFAKEVIVVIYWTNLLLDAIA
jgi:hypothetical protein